MLGEAKLAFKFNAANCALDTGLLSLVLSTFAKLYQLYLILQHQLYH
jgi:hypothetical protein